MKGRVEIKTPLYPTEDEEKVKKGILNIFPDTRFFHRNDLLIGTASDLDPFLDIIKRTRIRDTAREFLQKRRLGGEYVFELNKQTATVGIVNFVEERMSLGTILVSITPDDDEAFIRLLTP